MAIVQQLLIRTFQVLYIPAGELTYHPPHAIDNTNPSTEAYAYHKTLRGNFTMPTD